MSIPSLDTFLVALYTIVDDLYKEAFPHSQLHSGAKPVMSDSEILTLMLCLQWMHLPERKLIRYIKAHWQAYFPHLISQSQFNRRFHLLAKTAAYLVTLASSRLQDYFHNSYEVLDTIGVPLMRRCRGCQHKLFPSQIASIGVGGSDKNWYYGIKLAIVVSPQGVATGFILAPASTSDRWLAEYLLCYRHNPHGKPATVKDLPLSHKSGYRRVGPTGQIWPLEGVGSASGDYYLMDLGFTGRWWQQHWQREYAASCITSDRYIGEEATSLRHQHYSRRQVIETVNEHLSDDLALNHLGARSVSGLLARIAAKLLAFNLGVWLNKLLGRPTFALASLFSW